MEDQAQDADNQNAADSQMRKAESPKPPPPVPALIAAVFYVVAEVAWGPFHSASCQVNVSNNGIGQTPVPCPQPAARRTFRLRKIYLKK
jgi:hypothetical protein